MLYSIAPTNKTSMMSKRSSKRRSRSGAFNVASTQTFTGDRISTEYLSAVVPLAHSTPFGHIIALDATSLSTFSNWSNVKAEWRNRGGFITIESVNPAGSGMIYVALARFKAGSFPSVPISPSQVMNFEHSQIVPNNSLNSRGKIRMSWRAEGITDDDWQTTSNPVDPINAYALLIYVDSGPYALQLQVENQIEFRTNVHSG